MQSEPIINVRWLHQPGDVVEARVMLQGKRNYSGFFDDPNKLIAAVAPFDKGALTTAIYVTLNPVNPDLLARANNRLKPGSRGASDNDILRRQWLFIDFDPKRIADISSTDPEKALAFQKLQEVRTYLSKLGWPEPVIADSGNGWHLLYRVDLPNDAVSHTLLHKCLQALAMQFNDAGVDIDTTVHNASRIIKAYGSMVRKGDHTEDRPHRRSALVEVPSSLQSLTLEQLTTVADLVPETADDASFDLKDWLTKHKIEIAREGPWNGGGYRHVLKRCPWHPDNPDHDEKACVVRLPSGAIAASCRRNTCSEKRWKDLRALYDGPDPIIDDTLKPDEPTPIKKTGTLSAWDVMELSKTSPPEPIITKLLNVDEILLVHAPEESYKSFFVLQMGASLAFGRPFLCWPVPKCWRVGYMQTELHLAGLGERLNTMFPNPDDKETLQAGILFMAGDDMKKFRQTTKLEQRIEVVRKWIVAEQIDVLVIDPAGDVFREGDPGETEVGLFFDRLRTFGLKGIILVRHDRKPREQDVQIENTNDLICGSFEWKADPENIVYLKRKDRRSAEVVLTVGKLRYGVKPEPFSIYFDGQRFQFTPLPPVIAMLLEGKKTRQQILDEGLARFQTKQRAMDSQISLHKSFLTESRQGHQIEFELDYNEIEGVRQALETDTASLQDETMHGWTRFIEVPKP